MSHESVEGGRHTLSSQSSPVQVGLTGLTFSYQIPVLCVSPTHSAGFPGHHQDSLQEHAVNSGNLPKMSFQKVYTFAANIQI